MPMPVPFNTADARDNLTNFQRSTLLGDFCIQFNLTHRPRRGEDVVYTGIAWSSNNAQGPVTRFRLTPPPSADKTAKPVSWEWLVQDGPAPKIWVLTPGATTAREMPEAEWHTPLFPGMVYTPFDLLLPFFYWPDYSNYKTDRIQDRGVDVYTMKPPAPKPGAGLPAMAVIGDMPPPIEQGPVRIAIDRDIMALVRAEQLDAKGTVMRKFELSSFKKVQEHWMIHTADLLNSVTHDSDRFEVNFAAMNLKWDAVIFDPAKLATPAPQPPTPAWADMNQ